MPQDTPYAKCPSIVIRFNDGDAVTDRKDWSDKVTALLDQIHTLPLGAELMADIAQTKHTVYVQPALAQGNQCGAANYNCYVRLRQGLEGFGSADFKVELKRAFEKAERSKMSMETVATRLASGMSAVTVETARNVAKSNGWTFEMRKKDSKGNIVQKKIDGYKQDVWVDAKLTPEKVVDLLQGLMDGSRKKLDLQIRRGGRYLSDDLIRCFYIPNPSVADEYLQRGAGCNATISFKPDVDQSCWMDEHVTRPPGIGLVHELIHAWRNVHGLRYFKDKEKIADAPTPDDEVMTTGFPPYQWEKYTENMFRGIWAINSVGAIHAPNTALHGHQPLRHKY